MSNQISKLQLISLEIEDLMYKVAGKMITDGEIISELRELNDKVNIIINKDLINVHRGGDSG